MPQLTNNFIGYVTEDNQYFAVENITLGGKDGGYALGEYAEFEDEGIRYSVTFVADANDSEKFGVDFQIIQ